MAGIQGLIKCLDTFEPEKGFKLSTYAHSQIFWAIKHSLARPLTTMMKSSTRMAGTAMKCRPRSRVVTTRCLCPARREERYVLRCVEMHGRSANELPEAMGISGERVRQIRRGYQKIQNAFKESPKWEHLF